MHWRVVGASGGGAAAGASGHPYRASLPYKAPLGGTRHHNATGSRTSRPNQAAGTSGQGYHQTSLHTAHPYQTPLDTTWQWTPLSTRGHHHTPVGRRHQWALGTGHPYGHHWRPGIGHQKLGTSQPYQAPLGTRQRALGTGCWTPLDTAHPDWAPGTI